MYYMIIINYIYLYIYTSIDTNINNFNINNV